MTQVDVTLILTIFGVLFSLTTIGLLTASQIKQNWISYVFVETRSLGGITFTITTNADIGIWETSFTAVTVFSSIYPTQTASDTIDSSTTTYFSEGNTSI